MTDRTDDWDEDDVRAWEAEAVERALSPEGIAEQNASLLRRYRDFRRAADAIAKTWRSHAEVRAIALIGSLAKPPYKEVPRFQPYRGERIELWHECKDVDLALWLDHLDGLDALRRAKTKALTQFQAQANAGLADHYADAFILEPGSNRYLGRLCNFKQCPKGKRECLAPGCGASPFLRQHEGFRWRSDSLAPDRMLIVFDRASGLIARAADLALPEA
jgi:hypothetical protein